MKNIFQILTIVNFWFINIDMERNKRLTYKEVRYNSRITGIDLQNVVSRNAYFIKYDSFIHGSIIHGTLKFSINDPKKYSLINEGSVRNFIKRF